MLIALLNSLNAINRHFLIIALCLLPLFHSSSLIAAEEAKSVLSAIDKNRTITLHFNDAPIGTILHALAQQQQLNFAVIGALDHTLTIHIDKLAWQQAISLIQELGQIDITLQPGLMTAISQQEKRLREQQYQEARTEQLAKQPLSLLTVPLQYNHAEEVMAILLQQKGSLLSDRAQISIDAQKNRLYIYDNSDNFVAIQTLIAELDQPLQQVKITAHIVTISQDGLEELGVKWGLPAGQDLGIDAINTQIPSAMGVQGILNIAKINGRLLSLELSALEQENEVEIIASPQLLTLTNHAATIKQGTELPYEVMSNANGGSTIEFKSAVLGLEVIPKLLANDKIGLSLTISQNTPGRSLKQRNGGEVLAIDTQEIKTEVLVTNNETLVLGGVFQHSKQQQQYALPGLSKIPWLGQLFHYQQDKFMKRELIIFITPTLIKT